MKLHVIYRSSPGENRKNRPAYFDKGTALASFLRALERCPDPGEIAFLNDGPLPADRLALMRGAGRVIEESGLGNAGSWRRAVDLAADPARPAEDLVYLCEDDYLHLPDAFALLHAAAAALPADYFGLYDHPDRYTRHDDAEGGRTRLTFAGGRHWRTVESTCLTFAARAGALRRDLAAHRRAARAPVPDDRALWRGLQGLGFPPLRPARHRLVTPVPGLATHLETEYLAPGVDWEAEAAAARAWLAARTPAAG